MFVALVIENPDGRAEDEIRRINFDLVKFYEARGAGQVVLYYKGSGHDTANVGVEVLDKLLDTWWPTACEGRHAGDMPKRRRSSAPRMER